MKKNKWNVTIVLVMAIALFLSGCGTNDPSEKAIKILENDYGKNIEITALYYNESQDGCIVEFISDGKEDVACVHLDSEKVGYESKYEELSQKMQDASNSSKQKEKYASELIEYPYDALWVFNLTMKGTADSGWEKID